MRNATTFFLGLLLLLVMSVKADEIQRIPGSYQGEWRSRDDTMIIAAIVRDKSVTFVDEGDNRSHCKARSIEKYKTGFFTRKEVVLVTCEKANPKEVKNLNRILQTEHRVSDTTWTIYLSKNDDNFTMNINDCLEPFSFADEPCSRTVGAFYRLQDD